MVNNARSLNTLAVQVDGTTDRETFLSEFDVDVVQPYRLTMALANSPGSRLSVQWSISVRNMARSPPIRRFMTAHWL